MVRAPHAPQAFDRAALPPDAGLYVELALDAAEQERLRAVAPGPVWFAEPDSGSTDDARVLAESHIALGNPRPDWVEKAPQLRWLQLASVGIDRYVGLDWPALGQRLTVTNLGGLFADPVAETCLAGILALYRGVDVLAGLRTRESWSKLDVRPGLRLLGGANVLILGRGSIALRLAELLAPFGCSVAHFARSDGDIRTRHELDARLSEFDIVVGLLPGTAGTADLFDRRRIDGLRPGAVFVNAGRGTLADEDALVAALASGRLGGAVLDVTREEPLPAGHPLWSCPNVILTQHTAGGSRDETERVIDLFADNWQRLSGGEPLHNVVRWSQGY
ncbi:D-2-hydroxyacid dehydrogenase [Streptomyces durmitorensis]|uniref:D-2-hydroxyacid dehydrogenase n=1 Tax=Streptomyces durmitorensis TaxID=319947 RepID=A0ABY4PMV4_9ACTN|nr:D-2-hydroxyacid dehydrogenase [Streptomyces durmitorensis]UQT54268.1 D-2-hydroxyacid dehydrogenase [Streptomyces durmitorensis]